MPNLAVSCLVCTHRAPASMGKLIESLMQQQWLSGDEVVFIDNGVASSRWAELDGELSGLRETPVKVILDKEHISS